MPTRLWGCQERSQPVHPPTPPCASRARPQTAPVEGAAGAGAYEEGRFTWEDGLVAEYLWLYPNLMVNVYTWGISVNLVEPTGPGRCRVRYLRWVARPALVETGVGSGLDQVELEDQAVVHSVQKGVRSRLYPGGRFSPEHEAGPHHFQRLLAADLSL